MKAIPYFNFANTLEVLEFYQKLGATDIQMVLGSDEMFMEMPESQRPKNPEKFVMNAEFKMFGNKIFVSDTWDQHKADHTDSNISFVFDLNDSKEVQAVKDFFTKATELGCTIEMPLEEAEWTEMFGMIKDPFGLSWMFSGEN